MPSPSTIRILVFGDVVSKPGRRMLAEHLPAIREQQRVDLVLANVENLAHGKGITPKTLDDIKRAGVDVFTSGNHVLQKDGPALLADPALPLIRPANFPADAPGRGTITVTVGSFSVLIVNLIGTTFFRDAATYGNPFQTADAILESLEAERANAILVDWHADATSEKVALGWYLDGRVSAVFGTHTHVPSADLRILSGGTAYRTDIGMTGLRDEILGAEKGIIINNFVHPDTARPHIWTDDGPTQLHAVLVEVDPATKRAVDVVTIDRENAA